MPYHLKLKKGVKDKEILLFKAKRSMLPPKIWGDQALKLFATVFEESRHLKDVCYSDYVTIDFAAYCCLRDEKKLLSDYISTKMATQGTPTVDNHDYLRANMTIQVTPTLKNYLWDHDLSQLLKEYAVYVGLMDFLREYA